MVVVVGKDQILGIAIDLFDKASSVPKDKLYAKFDIILKSFCQRSACVTVYLPLLCKK